MSQKIGSHVQPWEENNDVLIREPGSINLDDERINRKKLCISFEIMLANISTSGYGEYRRIENGNGGKRISIFFPMATTRKTGE